ncbi:aminotransferase class III-fold pyridoxal phosphate-dependent enzyme [Pedobacter caeni]|uniref:Adenosylmethionine-8-amino-7-oxononanoate aminotransferase n=1 Tax=Pedobacter caeni TaxID=288992 RepID=A0A1M4T6T8_9SPHI|nr:aminotransferase class III-fold pyridoxal phosphate-dependent enzyme [Pedobacter caeni]SHE40179.1 Adenosylmethionine-8-amino-7-oxononanoate aminotransferase [Pedobacter caeni]
MFPLNEEENAFVEPETTTAATVPDYWGPFAQLKKNESIITEMANYQGLMARLNDALFLDRFDLKYYSQLAKEANGAILELGCGSGRVTIPLFEEGHTITGLDNSQDMLDILLEKLKQPLNEHSRMQLQLADARNYEFASPFDLIIFPYCSLQLFTDPSDRKKIMQCAARHLAKGGIFAFDVTSPEMVVNESILELDLRHEQLEITITLGIKAYDDENIMVENSFWEVNADDKTHLILEFKKLAMLRRQQLEDELESAGLVISRCIPTAVDQDKNLRYLYVCSKREDVEYPLWHPYLCHQPTDKVLTLVSGKGCIVVDSSGKSYLDASGGLWSVQCGLGNQTIINAINQQLNTISYATLFAGRGNLPSILLARKLVQLAPFPLQWVYFTGSGSESVELGIKLARQYWYLEGKTEKNHIAYLDQSYHGTFFGSMGVTGLCPEAVAVGPGVPGLHAILTPHPDQCPDNQKYEDYALHCAESLSGLAEQFPDKIAAFIFEPVLGSAGVVIPPQSYFDRIKEICSQYKILLIVDEVATGFGRTGDWFCSTRFGIKPDILLLSKGINSGYLPLGATLFSAEIGNMLSKSDASIVHGSSHNGNPACCAAALASIEEIERLQLIPAAIAMGDYCRDLLEELMKKNRYISQVRQIGLMIGIAICQDDGKPASDLQIAALYELMKSNGVLTYPAVSSIVLMPALIINKDEIRLIAAVLEEALHSLKLINDHVTLR